MYRLVEEDGAIKTNPARLVRQVKEDNSRVRYLSDAEEVTLRDVNRRSLPGLEFAGGDLTISPYSEASSANITPDPSGISYYDEAQFLKTIRTRKVGARQISPNMPWWYFAHMSNKDLKSVFAFLRTIKPVHYRVDNTESVAQCRICGRKHAGGALN